MKNMRKRVKTTVVVLSGINTRAIQSSIVYENKRV